MTQFEKDCNKSPDGKHYLVHKEDHDSDGDEYVWEECYFCHQEFVCECA